MSDELDPTTPPMPEARPADPAPLAPPSALPSGDPLPAAAARPVTAGRGGMNRTRTIAGLAALAAGVAITAGIVAAARDDSATTSASTDASTSTADQPATQSSEQDRTVGELPSLDSGSATGVPGPPARVDDGTALDGDGRVGPGEGGAQMVDGAPPEGARGHHGAMGAPGVTHDRDGDAAGSAMPAPSAGGRTATVPATGSQSGTPDASSQGS
jgi:hypothetical protein